MTTPTDPTPSTAATARDALAALVKAIDYTHGTRHLRHADQPKALRMAGADCYCSVNAAVEDARQALAAAEAPGRVAAMEASLNDAYTERNRLVAALIKVGGYPAVTFEDQSEPGWWVVYADTPAGQVSWHVGIRDIGLFLDAPAVIGNPWDGHSTDEKYRRVAALAAPASPAGVSGEVCAHRWPEGPGEPNVCPKCGAPACPECEGYGPSTRYVARKRGES